MIIAIDPGPEQSGVCVLESDYRPVEAKKLSNWILMRDWLYIEHTKYRVVIEMIGHYGTGMPAGKEVFDTCVWIGRFVQFFNERGVDANLLMRHEVKMHLCHSTRAKDPNIRQALVDRFAPGQSNHGKGTKKAPGWFYGFAADEWQAYALGVTYMDLHGGL